MKLRHQAVAAGLSLALACAAAQNPAPAYAQSAQSSEDFSFGNSAVGAACARGVQPDEGAADGTTPFDRADAYEELSYGDSDASTTAPMASDGVAVLSERASSRLAPLQLSWEMKYFAQNESGSNYRLGFSYGDGYNALGFYQFDRRYSLIPFMQACYDYNAGKYAMFAPVLARADEVKTGVIYNSETKSLTDLGKLVQSAWYAAYDQDPTEFSALQDAYGYENYYLPAERVVKAISGVDISGRADCVKGLVWSITNLFGQGGCQKFFRDANLTSAMSDRELVNAICDSVVRGVYEGNYTYADSYAKRYERERATCLSYLDQHEAEGGNTGGGTGGSGDSGNGSAGDNGNSGNTGGGEDDGEVNPFFSDVTDDDWFFDSVIYVARHRIMNGYGDNSGRFGPNEPIMRQDVAVVLYNYLGNGAVAPKAPQSDVDQNEYYAKAVNWAVSKGYIKGYDRGDGVSVTFGVNDPVTREQLAVIMDNVSSKPANAANVGAYQALSDSDKTSWWAQDSMKWAVSLGVINGVEQNGARKLLPQGTASRAMMATIMVNCIHADVL